MKKIKKSLKDKPFVPLPEVQQEEDPVTRIDDNQSMNQKKIALVQNGNGPVIVEMIRDVLQQVPLVGNSEWETIKNSIIIDTSSTILRDMVDYIDSIKNGSLIGKK